MANHRDCKKLCDSADRENLLTLAGMLEIAPVLHALLYVSVMRCQSTSSDLCAAATTHTGRMLRDTAT